MKSHTGLSSFRLSCERTLKQEKQRQQFLVKAEAVAQSFEKKLFLKILENSHKMVCDRMLIVTLQTHIFQL